MTILDKQLLVHNDIMERMMSPENVELIAFAVEMYVGAFFESELDEEIEARQLTYQGE